MAAPLLAYPPYLMAHGLKFNGAFLDYASLGTVKVLFLGDSMSLCGFGQRLDRNFRSNPRIHATFSYMAGGTNPLSWLKEKPYSTIKTSCGYLSIESMDGRAQPIEFEVADGKPNPVPKLEDLLTDLDPDVLVFQSGNNLYDLFRDRKTVNPEHNGPLLDAYIHPFLSKALQHSNRLRKIYWVAPPITGRISSEIQEFVFQEIAARSAGVVTLIDSRPMIPYPYKKMQKDLTHFVGSQMNEWADKVYALIEHDLAAQPVTMLGALPALPPLPSKESRQEKLAEGAICVEAELTFKSRPMPTKELLPYKESLVAFVYKINKVVQGPYAPEKIVVMHPAHLRLKEQDLSNRVIGQTYKLQVHPLSGTVWRAEKCRDETDELDLLPYIQVEDEKKFPSHDR